MTLVTSLSNDSIFKLLYFHDEDTPKKKNREYIDISTDPDKAQNAIRRMMGK